MKKTADNIRIIGKSDGPTSVFIAGKDKKKTLRQKIEKSMYDFRRKRVIKFLRADSHSVDEVEIKNRKPMTERLRKDR